MYQGQSELTNNQISCTNTTDLVSGFWKGAPCPAIFFGWGSDMMHVFLAIRFSAGNLSVVQNSMHQDVIVCH